MRYRSTVFSQSDFELGGSVSNDKLTATPFRYKSGVPGLTVSNGVGEITVLPHRGFQIWRANFHGHELGMESLVKEPTDMEVSSDPAVRSNQYLTGYGGFLVHCGPRRMGCPGEKDDHPLHGFLPLAYFEHPKIGFSEDGETIILTGKLNDAGAKGNGYAFDVEPLITMRRGSALIDVSLKIVNQYDGPMEIMQLEHANFRTVPGSRLVYSAPCTPETITVRDQDPEHIKAKLSKAYLDFRGSVKENPIRHNTIAAEPIYDPELVLYLQYQAGSDGWAHSMQVMPDGFAHYVAHKPAQFPVGIRWIRTAQPDPAFPVTNGFGLVLPATARPEGYTAAIAAGMVPTIPKDGSITFDLRLVLLTPTEAAAMEKTIDTILGR